MFSAGYYELQSEWNARYDDTQERYAGEKLDSDYEAYCDYCSGEAYYNPGQPIMSFEDWKSAQDAFLAERVAYGPAYSLPLPGAPAYDDPFQDD